MNIRRLLLLLVVTTMATGSLLAQFNPRKDYVWARDISVASNPAITLDGKLNETVWAQAESVTVKYGVKDQNPGSGYKIMNGTGTPGDPANAVLKFLVDKTKNMLYIGVTSKDSSVGGKVGVNHPRAKNIIDGMILEYGENPTLGRLHTRLDLVIPQGVRAAQGAGAVAAQCAAAVRCRLGKYSQRQM